MAAAYNLDVVHCDFCLTTEHLVATYHVDPFSLPAGYVLPDRGYLDDGQWAACAGCHLLLQDDNRKKLLLRSLRSQIMTLGPNGDDQRVAVYTRRMMDAFFEHYHGSWSEGV